MFSQAELQQGIVGRKRSVANCVLIDVCDSASAQVDDIDLKQLTDLGRLRNLLHPVCMPPNKLEASSIIYSTPPSFMNIAKSEVNLF